MTEHSPWYVKGPNAFNGFNVYDNRGFSVVEDTGDKTVAHLIAAAPDMLAALRNIANYETHPVHAELAVNDMRDMARAAIAKAEGAS